MRIVAVARERPDHTEEEAGHRAFPPCELPEPQPTEPAARPGRTLSLLSSRAEMRGLDAERERAEPRSLAASRVSATALNVLWLPVFLSPRRHEEGDSSLGSSSWLNRLAIYTGRREKERAACLCALASREAHRPWVSALPSLPTPRSP